LYAGLPAANAAMHMAEEVFKELGIGSDQDSNSNGSRILQFKGEI
jgi:hypothetical protein